MDGRHSLEWAQKNRERHDRIQPVGELARRLVDAVATGGGPGADELATTLAPMVDGQFRRHCRIVGVRGGLLVINVDQPGLVCPLRLAWSRRLGKFLAGERRWRSVKQIRFEFGSAGRCVAEPRALPG